MLLDGQLPLNPAQQVVGFFHPTLLERRQLRTALGHRLTKNMCQRARRGFGQRHRHQCTHVLVERGHVPPDALHLRHQRVAMG